MGEMGRAVLLGALDSPVGHSPQIEFDDGILELGDSLLSSWFDSPSPTADSDAGERVAIGTTRAACSAPLSIPLKRVTVSFSVSHGQPASKSCCAAFVSCIARSPPDAVFTSAIAAAVAVAPRLTVAIALAVAIATAITARSRSSRALREEKAQAADAALPRQPTQPATKIITTPPARIPPTATARELSSSVWRGAT